MGRKNHGKEKNKKVDRKNHGGIRKGREKNTGKTKKVTENGNGQQ